MRNKNIFKLFAVSSLALASVIGGMVPQFSPLVTTAYAAELNATSNTPNGNANLGSGSASITINANQGQSMFGKKFEVYKLFNAENSKDGESINYTWNTRYKSALQTVVGAKLNKAPASVTEYDVIDYIQTLNNHKVEGATANQELEGRYSAFRYFVEELRDEIVNQKLGGSLVTVTQTNAQGGITIGGLDYGYYIVDEVNVPNNNGHSAASLCMVNTANPTATVNIKSDYPQVTKKIEEDDNNTGWNDVADYEIGQTVPYKYNTTVPNMNGYHTYYLAFHDKMSEALTFNQESVQITITGLNKTYTLQNTEFVIQKNVNGNTFQVNIPNLKAIVDREFPEGLDNDNQNQYGQAIQLNYTATLNDKAASQTGRPGFENTVRVEFSNNPDSNGTGDTGFTPWDTVVCFTYKIDALKINNHNKTLEGAKFRLYSDKDCKNEVYLKSSPEGYIVINRDSLGGDDHTGGSVPGSAVEMVSNADGVFKIFGLDQGTYWLKETDSPDGYRELLDPIEITITPTFTTDRDNYVAGEGATDQTLKTLTATAHMKEFLNGAFNEGTSDLKTDVDTGTVNITVVNQVGTKLPVTGSSATVIMLGAGVVLASIAIAKNKRKDSAE
jgi:fimbrial isopeptide formation D2 family protein